MLRVSLRAVAALRSDPPALSALSLLTFLSLRAVTALRSDPLLPALLRVLLLTFLSLRAVTVHLSELPAVTTLRIDPPALCACSSSRRDLLLFFHLPLREKSCHCTALRGDLQLFAPLRAGTALSLRCHCSAGLSTTSSAVG